MRNLGGVLERSGKHIGRYKVNGKTYYTSAFPTKKAAERELKIIQGKLLSGEWEIEHPTEAGAGGAASVTFGQAWEERLAKIEKTASPNSLRSYRSTGNKYLLPLFKNKELSSFTQDDLRALQRKLEKEGVAPNTHRNILSQLSAFLTYARERGIEIPQIDFSKVPKKPKTKTVRNALTAAQLDAVIEQVEPEKRLLFALAGYCALRYGEVVALEINDISLENMAITVNKAVKRGVGGELSLGSPKSLAGYRVVSIPEKLRGLVEEHLVNFTSSHDSRLFYDAEGVSGWWTDRVLRARLTQACAAAGVPRVVFHELRHTGLTLFAQAGATLAELMYRAGHSDAKTVMVYQHASLERDRELAARLG